MFFFFFFNIYLWYKCSWHWWLILPIWYQQMQFEEVPAALPYLCKLSPAQSTNISCFNLLVICWLYSRVEESFLLFVCLFVRTSWEIEWFHKHFVNNCFLGVCWHWDVNLEWSKYCESWILKVQLLHHWKRCTLTAYVPFCLQFCFIWPAQCFQVLKFEHSCLKWPCTGGPTCSTLCVFQILFKAVDH